MSPPYRIERERMAPGQTVPTFRIVVDLGRSRWGTVQVGLDRTSADALLARLMENEAARKARILRGVRYASD
jgi:hypothetical protein